MKLPFSFTRGTLNHLRLLVDAAEKLMKKGYKSCMLTEPSFVDLIAIKNDEMIFVEIKGYKGKFKFTPNEQLIQKLCKKYGIKYFVFNGEFNEL